MELSNGGETLNYNLTLKEMYKEKEEGWFVDDKWNAIFRISLKDSNVQYVDFDEHKFGQRVYRWVAKWQDKLIMIPCEVKNDLYVIMGNERYYASVRQKGSEESAYVYRGITQVKEHLYLFTDDPKNMIIDFNLETENTQTILEEKDNLFSCDVWKTGKIVMYDNCLLCTLVKTNFLVAVCLENNSVLKYEVEDTLFGYDLFLEEDILWTLSADNRYIYSFKLNKDKKNVQKYRKIDISAYIKSNTYDYILVNEQQIWLLPKGDGYICQINLLTEQCSEIPYPEGFEWIKDKRYHAGIRFDYIDENDTEFILYPRVGNGILYLNKKTSQLTFKELKVNQEKIIMKQLEKAHVDNLAILDEEIVNLQSYLEIIMKK